MRKGPAGQRRGEKREGKRKRFSAGCNALLGALNGSGFTLRNLNVTALAEKRKQNAVTGLISMVQNTHFLIEGCTFLHLTATTQAQVPIFSTLMASEGVVRNNLWQVGSQGFHLDRSYHIVQESNVYSE